MTRSAFAALTLVGILAVAAAVGLLAMYGGWYNVAATDEHSGLGQSVLQTTKDRSIRVRAENVSISVPTDTAALQRGHRSYEAMCTVCHGAPGVERGWMGKGMNPQPPDLAESAKEFSAEEVYWILRNGIKLAGMPALEPTHSEDVMLELTAFVKALPEISEEQYAAFTRVETSSAPDDGHANHAH